MIIEKIDELDFAKNQEDSNLTNSLKNLAIKQQERIYSAGT